MKLLWAWVLTLAISASGRNFGVIEGSPLEQSPPTNPLNNTDSSPPVQGTKAKDGEQTSVPIIASSEPIAPWSAWMNLKAPPAAFLKPKKKPFPPFAASPVVPPTVSEVMAPWIAWTKMKAPPAFVAPTGPVSAPETSESVSKGESEVTPAQTIEAPWVSWTKMKAPPAFIVPAGSILKPASSPLNPAGSVEAPWVSWTKLKVPSVVDPLLAASPVTGTKPFSSDAAGPSVVENASTPDSDGSGPVPSIPESLANPTISSDNDLESDPADPNFLPIDILKTYLSKMLQLPPGEQITAENAAETYATLPPVINTVNPAQSPLAQLIKPTYQEPVIGSPVLSPTYEQFFAEFSKLNPSPVDAPVNPLALGRTPPIKVSQYIPGSSFVGPLEKPVNSLTLNRIPITQPQYTPSILPEQMPSLLAWMENEKLKQASDLPAKPSIPLEISVEDVFDKATPAEKALLQNPAVIEFIKSMTQENVPIPEPSAITGPSINPVEYPFIQPVTTSSSLVKPTFPVSTPGALSPRIPIPTSPYFPSLVPSTNPVYPFQPIVPQKPGYLPIGAFPSELEYIGAYPNAYPPSWFPKPIPIPTSVPLSPVPVTQTKPTVTGLAVAEDKLLVKWAKKIFELQKNNSFIPTDKPSIIESAWTDWLKLHNQTIVPSQPSYVGPVTPKPPTIDEINQLIEWLKINEAILKPDEVAQLIEWIGDLTTPTVRPVTVTPVSIFTPVAPRLPTQLPLPYPFARLPIPNPTTPIWEVPAPTKQLPFEVPPTNPDLASKIEVISEVMRTASPEVKAYLESVLAANNIEIPQTPVPFQIQPIEPLGPEIATPGFDENTTPQTLADWLAVNVPQKYLETVTANPTAIEVQPQPPVDGVDELTPAQFSIVLKKILEECNKTSLMVPRAISMPINKQESFSEEVDHDTSEIKRALYPSQSLGAELPTPSPGLIQSKLDLVPQEFWDLVPTVAPNTTIMDPGYWAAKKSMFISKLFDALARVTMNYTNAVTTTENPKQKLMKQIDTVLLSDAARSIKSKDDDSSETSTDDEDLINSDEPENLPKEPENPLHKLFKFGVQKTILSDLSTTPASVPPTFPSTPTPVPVTPSLDKQKLLLEKLKSAYKSSKNHYKKTKKNKSKSKSKKSRRSTTTSSPIDFEELAKALLVQPSK